MPLAASNIMLLCDMLGYPYLCNAIGAAVENGAELILFAPMTITVQLLLALVIALYKSLRLYSSEASPARL